MKVFPGTKIIHTYRDPLKTLPSFLSMAYHGMKIFSDEVSPAEVGKFWSSKNAAMVQKSLEYRAEVKDTGFIDVSYYDLMKQPLNEVERIYAFDGLQMSDELKMAMTEKLTSNKQHKFGVHHYSLDDFGISRESVEGMFGDYRRRFDIPCE
jgi:hypothetical protein